jgi:hypothetical protein
MVGQGWYNQYRVYEDGRSFYRLCFSLLSWNGSSWSFLLNDVVQKVELYRYDQNAGLWILFDTYTREANEIKLSDEVVAYPFYDTSFSRWYYPIDMTTGDLIYYHEFYYLVDLTKNTPVDQSFYYITVYTDNGDILSSGIKQLKLEALPMIEARSIKSSWDKDGNLMITWAAPYSYNPPNTVSTRARLFIILADVPPFMQYLLVQTPTHMGGWFVPRDIVEQLKETLEQLKPEGHKRNKNRIDLVVQVRTTDNSNRTYSKTKSISLKD